MRSSNPFLNNELYRHLERQTTGQSVMSANGSANKAALLILIVFAGAGIGWTTSQSGAGMGLGTLGAIVGFVLAMVTMFKPHLASLTAPIYAVCKGLFLGSISVLAERIYPGIATQAMMGTIGVFMTMMVLYRTGIIKVTDRLRSIITSLVLGILVTYLISFVFSLFTGSSFLNTGGIGIIFSLIVIAVAAFCLLLDFDSIERAEDMGQPKYMEWFYAFSLLITLIWLYLEIFRLLSILRSGD